MANTSRMIWLDALRLSAGVSMVGLHASSDAMGQPFAEASPAERVVPLLFRVIIYTARTELFLIISVFLLLAALDRRPRGYRETIFEQVRRLLVPFAFWVVVYAFYSLIKASHFGYAEYLWRDLGNPTVWLGYFLLGDVKYHMHFLPTLFGLVLFYPLFRIAVAHPWIGLAIVVCLVIKREVDVFLWSNLKDMPGFDFLLRAVKVLTYCGYGLIAASFLGIWRRMPPVAERANWVKLVLFVGGLLFLLKLVHAYKVATTGTWQFNYTPGYWADFLMPAVLFALCMLLSHRAWPAWISRIAPYSFGIYLCHPLFLDLAEIATDGHSLSPTALVATKVLFAVTATSLFVWLLSKFRPLAWTIGLGPQPFASRTATRPRPIQQET